MEKITITVKEYEMLQDRIHTLEKEVASLDKAAEARNDTIIDQKDVIDFLLAATWPERVLQWGKIKETAKKYLQHGKK